jgi:hypothetical protein
VRSLPFQSPLGHKEEEKRARQSQQSKRHRKLASWSVARRMEGHYDVDSGGMPKRAHAEGS